MRFIVEENSRDKDTAKFAGRVALRMAYEKGIPVWLSVQGHEIKVLWWQTESEIAAQIDEVLEHEESTG